MNCTTSTVLCLPEDDNLQLEHVGEFIYMDGLWFYVNCVHVLVYVYDYSHNAWNE
jgi:hypothetical protein